ncbi:hypothetical protein [Methylobacterium oryzae]|uniref:HNH endonuclease n=1 Tax=Methylobacterium oryzae TaxID=334852 RepID=A0ABU7TJC9_9HYPH
MSNWPRSQVSSVPLPPPAQLLTAIRAEQARRRERAERDRIGTRCASLAGFVQEAWHVLEPNQPYVHGGHIEALCAWALDNGAAIEAANYGHDSTKTRP